MGEMLGQNMIIDNRPGAGGTIAAKAFARAMPDGYTLFLGYRARSPSGRHSTPTPGSTR